MSLSSLNIPEVRLKKLRNIENDLCNIKKQENMQRYETFIELFI